MRAHFPRFIVYKKYINDKHIELKFPPLTLTLTLKHSLLCLLVCIYNKLKKVFRNSLFVSKSAPHNSVVS